MEDGSAGREPQSAFEPMIAAASAAMTGPTSGAILSRRCAVVFRERIAVAEAADIPDLANHGGGKRLADAREGG